MLTCILLIVLMGLACLSLIEMGESAAAMCVSYALFVVLVVIIRCLNPVFGGLL